MNSEYKILSWNDVDPKDEEAAKRISQKLQLDDIYFAYNVPLQIWIAYNKGDEPESGINLSESRILNYMPRKERCETEALDEVFSSGVDVTVDDIKEFMRISALIVKNLAKQMENFDPLGGEDCNYIYYPNTQC